MLLPLRVQGMRLVLTSRYFVMRSPQSPAVKLGLQYQSRSTLHENVCAAGWCRAAPPAPSRRAMIASRGLGAACGLLLLVCSICGAQQPPALPAVNLGDTSFLDAIALPGGVAEIIGGAERDSKTFNYDGQAVPGVTDVHTGSALLHIAWAAQQVRFLGAWYEVETVLSGAYVDTGGHGIGQGLGDVTFSPFLLQWPKYRLFGMTIYQRVDFDFDAPLGRYSPGRAVNIGSNAWAINPYYVVTLYPAKRVETSWRVHYLWNSTNHTPPVATGDSSTQAGQAIHFNATVSYEIGKHIHVGANGYYLKQITDARANGIDLPHSRQQIGAIGPGAVVIHGEWFFYVNGYHEVGAENMSEGNKLVLRAEKVF